MTQSNGHREEEPPMPACFLTSHFSLLTSSAPRAALLLLLSASACAPQPSGPGPAAQRTPAQQAALEDRALSIVPLSLPIRLGDADTFTQVAALFSRDGKGIPYREAQIPVTHGPSGLVFNLEPVRGNAPAIRYELITSRGGDPVALRFSADAPLPDIALQATAPDGLLPVRLEAHNQPNVMHSLLGPAWFAACDGLYDPRADRAISIDRPFQYGPRPGQPAMLGVLLPTQNAREIAVTFHLYSDLLKGRFQYKLSTTQPSQPIAPAGTAPSWCILRPPGAPDAAALEQWLRGNLAFGGALNRIPPAGGVPELLCVPSAGTPADASAWRSWKKKLDKTKDIYKRVTERGEHYNWQHARELINTAIDDYWCHGIVRTNAPGPLLIDQPLALEHARMWVSLLGLSGQTVVLGDSLEKLPAERVELLRAILPPAPVRNVDLFAHPLPEQWVLAATREWKLSADSNASKTIEPLLIVGVFNFSAEPKAMPVDFATLMPALTAQIRNPNARFAAWDVWERRLVAVAKDKFALPMPASAHRVFCIVPVAGDRPVLLGAGRHIVQGQLELTELEWDPTKLSMSAAVVLPAHDPYELRLLMPDGDRSFDIDAVQAPGATTTIRRDGPVRLVTLTAEATARVRWTITFRPAAQPTDRPPAPLDLKADQNTRGVSLTWQGRNEQAALYRVYRDNRPLGEAARPEYLDSTAAYDQAYAYSVSAIDYAGRESPRSPAITQRTPIPASTNLTDLVPLVAEQQHLAVMSDTSAAGNPLRVGAKRYHRGLGTHTNARLVYHLGGGYERFTGEVGIDDETEGKGSAVFSIVADGEKLFTSSLLRGGMPAQPFAVSVHDRMTLELIISDGGDSPDNDHADWGNPYLEARVR